LSGELRVGLKSEWEREITESDVLAFAHYSGDSNPLHVEREYAQATGFGGPLVHGAFQVGLASAMLGMHLPVRNVLLASVNAAFPRPLRFPCRVIVSGEVTAWDAPSQRGNLKVTILDSASRIPTAEIHLGFTLHEPAAAPVARASRAALVATGNRKLVLVAGASGGIGSAITSALAGEYEVLALTNRHPLTPDMREQPFVTELNLDLADASWPDRLDEALGENALYGIVHAAWPGLPRGGLLEQPAGVLEQQLAFATVHIVALGRLLAKKARGSGRFAVLGSIAGMQKPAVQWAAYSLGKAALEQTVRLLAPELALKGITINAVCPSFVPTGINRQATERQRMAQAASIPAGRLCTTGDIVAAVQYLFSPEASFVSGQSIALAGGQL
jgi:NAD(P)-dependent dehydrogenase (short-subunit alcohol dehydrogenase family)/acyl dehydratase